MLKHLSLKNFILIDNASVDFKSGFNIISGETGSGKTIIMQALSLLFGQKAETKLIRDVNAKATLFASFELADPLQIDTLLKDLGVEIDPSEDLLLKREILPSGKSRAFINNTQVSLAALRPLATHLYEMISSSSQLKLKEEDTQLAYLDLFLPDQSLIKEHQKAYENEKQCKNALESLKKSFAESKQFAPLWKSSLEEIESADLKKGEDDELFKVFNKLSFSQELLEDAHKASSLLDQGEYSLFSLIEKLHMTLIQLERKESSFKEPLQELLKAKEYLNEISFFLGKFSDEIEKDPEQIHLLETRLSLINQLKKKYSSTIEEILDHKLALVEKLSNYEVVESKIQEQQEKLDSLTKKRKDLSKKLTGIRAAASTSFSKELQSLLRSLNLPSAKFDIKLTKSAPSPCGEDSLQYYFSANEGVSLTPLKSCASSGELSRVLLAIKLLLSKKQQAQLLVFDEIDANIGGETASLIAKMLKKLAQSRQILLITHFPQVAKHADHHLKIFKNTQDGCTKTQVQALSQEEKKQELLRMVGGQKELSFE